MAANFPVATIELDEKDLRALPGKLAASAERAVKKVGTLVEAKAVRKAPIWHGPGKKKGGNLKNSGTTEFSGSGFDTQAKVKFTAPYAIFVHDGTGIYGPKAMPFTREARNKKALFWPGAQPPVKKVTIRGMKARPFLKQAFEEEAGRLSELVFNS